MTPEQVEMARIAFGLAAVAYVAMIISIIIAEIGGR